jgi:outer membrane protein OmpA-like peptidoglycan-associated protein
VGTGARKTPAIGFEEAWATQYVLAGTLTPIDASKATSETFRISLSLTDIKTREVAASKTWLTTVGHTSHTGTEQFNEKLSMQRAITIQRRIEVQAPETAARLVSAGMGFRENLVGSGTDDLRDALDGAEASQRARAKNVSPL